MPAIGFDLVFDPVTHRYRLGGRDLISVTQALTEAGLIDARWFNEDAALRGTYVHQAILLDHEGDLEEESLDPVLGPYFKAYRKFRSETGFVVEACEERLFDELLGVAGTLDLRGRFGSSPDSRLINIVDIKTGTVPSHVGYQTAGYVRLSPVGQAYARWCLNLRADGTYRLEALTNRTDEKVFLAALIVAQAKRGWL